ncbi:MAG: transketolase [Candidatus Omnitrophota bacterium]
MNKKQIKFLQRLASEIRTYIIRMNCYANSGHPGGALSSAEIITYLFHKELNFSLCNYRDPERDRFILSKGHSCMVLYAALAQKGFFGIEEFRKLRKVNSILQGHPDRLKTPGVEFNSGSLGQGFSFALGCALGGKLTMKKFRVYVLLGDGELNEGQVWEGFMFGAFYKLDNLVAIVDYNKYQSDDLCSNVTALEPLADKFKAFGWNVLRINGHNFKEIARAFRNAKNRKGKPTVILADTIKGKGISFMENNPKWHGSLAPQGEEKKCAFQECGCDDINL